MNSIRVRATGGAAAVALLTWASPTLAWHAHWGQPLIVGNATIKTGADTPDPALPVSVSYCDETPASDGTCAPGEKHLYGLDIRFSEPEYHSVITSTGISLRPTGGYRRVTIRVGSTAHADTSGGVSHTSDPSESRYRILIPVQVATGMMAAFNLTASVRLIGKGNPGVTGNSINGELRLDSVGKTGFANTAYYRGNPCPQAGTIGDEWFNCNGIASVSLHEMTGETPKGQKGSQYFSREPAFQNANRAVTQRLLPVDTFIDVSSPRVGAGDDADAGRFEVCDGTWLVLDMEAITTASATAKTGFPGAYALGGSELVVEVTLFNPVPEQSGIVCPDPSRMTQDERKTFNENVAAGTTATAPN